MSTVRTWAYCTRCRTSYPSGFRVCPRHGDPLERRDTDPMLGAVLDARYRVEQLIGEGALGRVYQARHVRFPRRYAIKIASDRPSTRGQATARLLNEAEAGGRIDHPNLVGILDLGELAPGHPYLVMELVEGETLHAHLARVAQVGVEAALGITRQLALGLAHAHGLGLVHRDLTPHNVILSRDGRVRLLDFGIALVPDGESRRVTGPGLAIGTPAYMSPEQAAGEAVDARSDLYSLGVVLHEMLAGAAPRAGEAGEGAATSALAELIRWMTAPAASQRVDRAVTVIREIDAILARHRESPAWLPAPEANPGEWTDLSTKRILPPRGAPTHAK